MEIQSSCGDSLNNTRETTTATKTTASTIMSFMLSSAEFQDISNQANATADNLIKQLSVESAQKQSGTKSVGIIDLDQEDAFGDEASPDQEREFLTNLLDTLSEIEGEGTGRSVLELESPNSSNGSPLDVSVITLELQSALRQAESEISALHSQVQSKTQHLELAQRALFDYEEEVQLLNQQLKDLTEDDMNSACCSALDSSTRTGLSPQKRASCDSFVKELWRVKSGTHRIRKSLGEEGSILWTENSLPSSPMGDVEWEKLQREFENSKQKFVELKELYERVESQNKKLQKDQVECQEKLKTVSQELGETRNRLVSSEEECKRLTKEKSKLRTQLIQAEEELMCILQETPDVDEEVSTYRQRLKESQQQREVLLRDLNCARTELSNLKAAFDLKQNLAFSKNCEDPVQQQDVENKVNEVQEALDSKLRDCPALLELQNEGQDLKEQVLSLQEALNLALEAKGLLEQRLQDQQENSASVPLGLKIILEDISQLKENFQRERRIALHERTENENLIVNLQQEKEELICQVHQVTVGLNQLQEKANRVENELNAKRASSERYRIQAEHQIMNLRREKESAFLQLTQLQEALDLSLEAKSVLEAQLSRTRSCPTENRTKEMDEKCLAAALRRKVHSGNEAQVAQAALQAIDQLERSSSHFTLPSEANHSLDDFDCLSEPAETSNSQHRRVSSQQVRILRTELREISRQRDEAYLALKAREEKDAHRYNDIQSLQAELSSALEQHERLLPKFKEVLSAKREMELRVQSLTRDLRRQKERQHEMEDAVVSLLTSCERLILDSGLKTRGLSMPSLLDSIFTIKAELEEISSTTKSLHEGSDLEPMVVDTLKTMVDQERDLRKYFESQTVQLERLREETEPLSQSWSRLSMDWDQVQEQDYPSTEFQLQERKMITAKLQEKDQEISELFEELEQTRSGEEDFMQDLMNLQEQEFSHENRIHHLQSSEDFGERLNHLQECNEMLEAQLENVRSENQGLKIEKQHLLKRIESSSK